jgi:hypothetical protein
MNNKDSYILKVQYDKKLKSNYSLNDKDIETLKTMAKNEGRTLKSFVTYKLKKIILGKE